jgi:phosphatidylserine synthase
VVAGVVLFRHEYGTAVPWVPWILLAAMPVLGLLMISRFPYPHLVNRVVGEKLSPVAILVLVVAVVLAIEVPEALLGAAFVAYAAAGPVFALTSVTLGRPRWAFQEDEDEDEDPSVLVDEAERARDDAT